MFLRYFSRNTNTQTEKPPSTQDEKQNNDGGGDKTRIFVWSGGYDSVGHVAFQLDSEPTEDQKNDTYFSIWPKSTPAGGLTSVLPLQAVLCRKLEDDCGQEAPRPREDFADLLEPFELTPTPPDRVYDVEGLDKEKIKNEINRLENGINNREVRYQLLPGINTAGFFNKILSKNSEAKPEVYNCVTLTQHLLEVGGQENLPKASWTTPSKFGDALSEQPNVTRRTSP